MQIPIGRVPHDVAYCRDIAKRAREQYTMWLETSSTRSSIPSLPPIASTTSGKTDKATAAGGSTQVIESNRFRKFRWFEPRTPDTLTLDGSKVRLWGIDAPELKQKCGGAACGIVARDALQALVRGRVVTCVQKDRDRYQRVVASCQVAGGDLGELMVRSGNALDYRRYSKGRYRQAERDAEAQRAGIWAGRFVAPWDWRGKADH